MGEEEDELGEGRSSASKVIEGKEIMRRSMRGVESSARTERIAERV